MAHLENEQFLITSYYIKIFVNRGFSGQLRTFERVCMTPCQLSSIVDIQALTSRPARFGSRPFLSRDRTKLD